MVDGIRPCYPSTAKLGYEQIIYTGNPKGCKVTDPQLANVLIKSLPKTNIREFTPSILTEVLT